MTAPDVLVEGLSVSYAAATSRHQALNDVSVEIAAGEVVAVVGESGSGKSTLALAVGGLLRRPPALVESGTVLVGGHDLYGMSKQQLQHIRGRQIAMIFQDARASLNPMMRVGRQVGAAFKIHQGLSGKELAQATLRSLESVGIADAEDRLHAFPHELSGGMCQRVMIAIALACRPKTLLADEPTAALDVTVGNQILRLVMDQVRQRGMSLLLVTHNLGQAAFLADRIVVLYAGQVVEIGSPKELLTNPKMPYTAALFGAIPSVNGSRLARLPTIVSRSSASPSESGCWYRGYCSIADTACETGSIELIDVGENHVSRCLYPDRVIPQIDVSYRTLGAQ
ncbi:ABC transporter ATP-binding protein [Actinophytocola sp.]|uniref:ABC transporter ATP-binding protein n=1 Tax=Actinophytocola sp. TaxID=1872138 RepID=UPI003D6B0689